MQNENKKMWCSLFPLFQRPCLLNEILSKYTDFLPLFPYPLGYRHKNHHTVHFRYAFCGSWLDLPLGFFLDYSWRVEIHLPHEKLSLFHSHDFHEAPEWDVGLLTTRVRQRCVSRNALGMGTYILMWLICQELRQPEANGQSKWAVTHGCSLTFVIMWTDFLGIFMVKNHPVYRKWRWN